MITYDHVWSAAYLSVVGASFDTLHMKASNKLADWISKDQERAAEFIEWAEAQDPGE